jgi:hypothetical protein
MPLLSAGAVVTVISVVLMVAIVSPMDMGSVSETLKF